MIKLNIFNFSPDNIHMGIKFFFVSKLTLLVVTTHCAHEALAEIKDVQPDQIKLVQIDDETNSSKKKMDCQRFLLNFRETNL